MAEEKIDEAVLGALCRAVFAVEARSDHTASVGLLNMFMTDKDAIVLDATELAALRRQIGD